MRRWYEGSRGVLRALSLLLATGALSACRATAGAGEPAPEEAWPGATLDLTPDPARGELAVSVRVQGPLASAVREIRVARSWGGTHGAAVVSGARARDAEGEIPLVMRRDDGGPDEVLDLARPSRGGDLELRYRASATNAGPPFSLHLGREGMSGVGHAFLLLPRFDEPVPVRIRAHLGALNRGADAASSFGFGSTVITKATSEDLAHAVYVAGMLWREGGDADAEGAADDLVVLGNPPFDTRAAFERARAATSAVDRFFGAPGGRRPDGVHFVLVGQRGLGHGREGAYLTSSVGVWFDAQRPLDGSLDLAVAHELAHRYLGGSVRLVDARGHEAAWFAEGFTVHAARRAMLDAGVLSPGDFAADVNDLLGSPPPPGAEDLPSEYRRGAVLAAWLDAEIARASAKKLSLRDVLADLLARGGTLPEAALVDAVRARAPALAPGVERSIALLDAGEDARVELRDDSFAPCARRVVRSRKVLDLGFDARSLGDSPRIVRGVIAGSAAEEAGLQNGALVLRANVPDLRTASVATPLTAELVLADGKRVRYTPVATRREVSWEPGDLDACRAAQSSR